VKIESLPTANVLTQFHDAELQINRVSRTLFRRYLYTASGGHALPIPHRRRAGISLGEGSIRARRAEAMASHPPVITSRIVPFTEYLVKRPYLVQPAGYPILFKLEQ